MKVNLLKISLVITFFLSFTGSTLHSQVVKSERSTIKINTMALGQKPEPDILIISPETLKQDQTFQTKDGIISLAIRLLNPDAGVKIYVNNVEVLPTATAADVYIKKLNLTANLPTGISVSVLKNEKLVKEYQYSMVYTPEIRNISKYAINPGKYYALIIGNSNYLNSGIPGLKRPVEDAKNLKDVLVNRYTFDRDNVYALYDLNKDNVLTDLEELQRRVTPDDNLLIFYAGHGKMDKDADIGYWLLSDADPAKKYTWLSNGTLTENIKSIKAKHILLIADACYAGAIFEGRGLEDAPASIVDLYKANSRKAITSGGTTEVNDESKFAEILIQMLKENSDLYMSAEQLYGKIYNPVLNNSQTAPRHGVIQNVGDMGGDFIFQLREK